MFSPIVIPLLAGMFLAINMGGSGTSPSFSAAYGSNIIGKFAIPGLFGSFVLLGALIAGKRTAMTIGKGILPGDEITITITTIVLFSVALSLLAANLLKVPQSTSQATVAALCGPGIYLHSLNSQKLFYEIIPTWFILPIVSFVIVYIIGKFMYPIRKKYFKKRYDELSRYSFLRLFVIASACYVSFAIGSNNVANAAGPIASMVLNELNISVDNEEKFVLIMVISVLLIAPCFAIGSSVFGKKIVENTGKRIIEFSPIGAVVISLVTASLLLIASVTKGIPTSLVQLNTMAIIGLGVSKVGWKKMIVHKTVKKFWVVWIVAPLFSFFFSLLLVNIADRMDLLKY